MRIAVLPFNAGPDSRAELARQFANFIVEIASQHTDTQIDAANYMAHTEENGVPRYLLINPSEQLNEPDMIRQFFDNTNQTDQPHIDKLVDGIFIEKSGGGTFILRTWEPGKNDPIGEEEFDFLPGAIFGALRSAIQYVLKLDGSSMPAELADDEALFGTKDSEAFVNFVQGYDALKFLEQAQGNVISSFDPKPYMDLLLKAVEADADWEAPFLVLAQLCRACVQFRIGNAEQIEANLKLLTEKEPEDSRSWFALGEFYEAMGNAQRASDAFEASAKHAPEEPAILHRLARAQLALGMPVNAERNLLKAVEMEDDDKPSLDLLSEVLAGTGRAHEVPELWNDLVRKNPQNGKAHARYAMSLLANNRVEEGVRAFDTALEVLEDNTIVKRYYAPYLSQQGDDIDRAMDFYEDCIDVAPTDVQLLWEYAQTLARANREFEVPEVLKQILQITPDPNLRANASAWLIEIEQPQRAEVVQKAGEMVENGQSETAVKDLKPLRNWLADYWKLWMVLSTAHNQLTQYEEAEQAARRVLEIFPACEPAYVELNNALGGQGKNAEAYQLMTIALGNMPNSLPVAMAYAAAAKRDGKPDEARRIVGQIRQAIQSAEGDFSDLEAALARIES
ncbi:tetratricopeptide repeat protein [Kamptonema cortianum]|nr:tetratricopeptide repeat protein [Geitlerinema splendidum]MDK3156960.1 tetratricopeptide repeat protein [Kamptonema cortianum]